MSDFVTEWVLKLKDMMTAPAKEAQKSVEATGKALKETNAIGVQSEKQLQQTLSNTQQYRKENIAQIKATEKTMKELERTIKSTGSSWNEIQDARLALKKAKADLEYYNQTLKETEDDLEQINSRLDEFTRRNERIGAVTTTWNQFSELVGNVTQALSFAGAYKDMEANVQRYTGLSGEALDVVSGKVYKLSAQYGDNADDVGRAANAVSKNFGISFNDAIGVMEKGYLKGANLNGDMLDQFKEYSTVLAPLGYTAEEVMSKMALAGKSGIFSDKALDALKEGGLSLKEMDIAQQQALAGIGLLPSDLKDKTVKEAIEIVGAAMDSAGVTVQQRQKTVADIFRGAGEDAGGALVQALMVNTPISDIPSVSNAGTWIKGFMADVQSFVSQTVGGLVVNVTQFLPVLTGVSSGIAIFQSLAKVTWIQTAATKALTIATRIFSVALNMTPLGWVITGIGLIVAGVIALRNKFEWARGAVEAGTNSWKQWGKVILDFVLLPIKSVIAGLQGIWKLLHGDWSGAMKSFSSPFLDMKNDIAGAVKATSDGYAKGSKEFRHEQYIKARDAQIAKNAAGKTSASTDPTLLSFSPTVPMGGGGGKSTKGGGSGAGGGLSVSGSGGRAINMTLTVHNNFNGKISNDIDVRTVANKVTEMMVDQLRDVLVTQ